MFKCSTLCYTHFQKAIGTNPISFGAPAKQDDYFMLDMATSTVAYGKVIIIMF